MAGLAQVIEKMKVGSGFDKTSTLGPIINETQYNKIVNYIKSGLEEGETHHFLTIGNSFWAIGATAAIGGVPKDSEGYFIPATVFTNVNVFS